MMLGELPAMGDDVATLAELNEAYLESVKMGDVDRFREILADDFLCSAADGSVLDKTQFLELTAGPRTLRHLSGSMSASACLAMSRSSTPRPPTRRCRGSRARAVHRRLGEARRRLARGGGARDASVKRRLAWAIVAAISLVGRPFRAADVHAQPPAAADADWPVNGGVDNIRYSPLTQINRDNVSQLQVAWTYDSHDAFKGSEMQSNPVVVDGVLYVTTPTLKVVAVDAANRARDLEVRPERRRGDRRAVPAPRRHRPQGSGVRHLSQLPLGARPKDRRADRVVRHRTGASICAKGSISRPSSLSVSASTPGVVFEDMLIMGSTRAGDAAGIAGPHPRVRREHRQAALDLPHDSEAGRVRLRHVAEGRASARRRRERVGRRHRRSEARDGVRRHRIGVVRFLRRHPPRRQPVRRLRAGARRAHRPAHLALPGHQARRLGLGLSRPRRTSSP